MNHKIKILILSVCCYSGISAQSSSITVTSSLNNTMDRPTVSPGTINGEIRGLSSNGAIMDDGFLRVSAGGGTNSNTKSFIDLSGSTTLAAPDRAKNITFGTSGLERMRIDYAGNIGIGTVSPQAPLHVVNGYQNILLGIGTNTSGYNLGIGVNDDGIKFYNSSANRGFYFENATGKLATLTSNGRLGIGTISPQSTLDIRGHLTMDAGVSPAIFTGTGTVELNRYLKILNSLQMGSASGLMAGGILVADDYTYANPGKTDLVVKGKILIGKSSQTNNAYKLDVAGNIRADKVVVNTTGADFVFDSSYQLPLLSEVADFINANKRLPGIASAAQMQQEGLEIGEHQTKLLQKTEELMLYAIDQDKRLAEQDKKLIAQDKKITSLEKKLSEQSLLIEKLLKQLTLTNSNQP